MKPDFVPHPDYQDFVLKQLHTHFGPGLIINKDWPLVAKLWMTDHSPITTLLQNIGNLNQKTCFRAALLPHLPHHRSRERSHRMG